MKGKPDLIQANKSKVILHVPDGVHGAILANIHANAARFNHHIPENDCLVAPICEYHLQEPYREPFLRDKYNFQFSKSPLSVELPPPTEQYKIQIPHFVSDIERVRPHLKVRHGNIHSGVPALDDQGEKVQHSIDDKYVTILTSYFSGYIITAEGINCCGQTAKLLFFGSLRNRPDTKLSVLATVKAFISSKIRDFQNVSLF